MMNHQFNYQLTNYSLKLKRTTYPGMETIETLTHTIISIKNKNREENKNTLKAFFKYNFRNCNLYQQQTKKHKLVQLS